MSQNTSSGIGLGTVIAALVSWTQWHSFGWAFIHGLFGWFYVIGWAIGLLASRPLF